MILDSVQLNNFRCFTRLSLGLNPKLNVIIGSNGAGKTTILDAISIALITFVSKFVKTNESKLAFKDTDINNLSNHSYINCSIDSHHWQVERNFQSNKTKQVSPELDSIISKIYNELKLNSLASVPIVAYYSVNRTIFDDKYKYNIKNLFPEYQQFIAYRNCFHTEINNFSEFVQWFEIEEGYEDKIRLESDNNYRNPKLKSIRTSIEVFLSYFGNQISKFSNLRIKKIRDERVANSPIVSSLVINKNGNDYQLSQLSSGEKMMLMLVVDIARRLTIANPALSNPLDGFGIVLIDEIELHLHPQWQREILPALNKTFSNLQFIVTTHSPQVLSKIKNESIRLIEQDTIVDFAPITYGKDSNSILYDAFNTLERPKEIHEMLNLCFQKIDGNEIVEAEKILGELTAILGENDTEVIRAKTLIMMVE